LDFYIGTRFDNLSIVYFYIELIKKTETLELNQIIASAIAGKQSAYKTLLDEYWNDVYLFQKSRINNKNDAEDITIQTFAKAFANLKQYNPKYDFKNWLLMISKQVYIDNQRKKKMDFVSIKENNEVFRLRDNQMAADDQLILEQNLLALKQAINQLKPHYREVIKLRYFEDLSYKEISEKIGEPLNNVKIKLLRAKKLLEKILNDKSR